MELLEIIPMEKGKLKLVFDQDQPLILYKSEVKGLGLQAPMTMSQDLYQKLFYEVLGKRVTKRAMYLLQKMDRTECQLRRKLEEADYPDELIDGAVEYVKGYHYIDDLRYARNFVRVYKDTRSRGRLRRDLLLKGVEEAVIQLALEEEDDIDPSDLICKILEKRNYDPQTASQKEKQKIYRFLIGRGFPAGEIMRQI